MLRLKILLYFFLSTGAAVGAVKLVQHYRDVPPVAAQQVTKPTQTSSRCLRPLRTVVSADQPPYPK